MTKHRRDSSSSSSGSGIEGTGSSHAESPAAKRLKIAPADAQAATPSMTVGMKGSAGEEEEEDSHTDKRLKAAPPTPQAEPGTMATGEDEDADADMHLQEELVATPNSWVKPLNMWAASAKHMFDMYAAPESENRAEVAPKSKVDAPLTRSELTQLNKGNRRMARALAVELQTNGPPRRLRVLSKLETLPPDVLARIHILADNTRLAAVSPALCASLSNLHPMLVAAFFLNRYRDLKPNRALSLALKYPVVKKRVAQIIAARAGSTALGPVSLPPRLIPSDCKIKGAERKMLFFVLENYKMAQPLQGLLEAAVLCNDTELAALLFHTGVKVSVRHVVTAITRSHVHMVKILLQHPLRPHRRHQSRGIALCPRILFAAVSRPDVAGYVAAVLAREVRDRRLHTRATFTDRGKYRSGHMIGFPKEKR